MYIMYMRTPEAIPFWERAKKLIRAHKISQEKFAAYIGISFGTLKNWLCYGIIPDAETTYNIAVALGVSMEYLIKGTDGAANEQRKREALTRKIAAADIKNMALEIEKNAGLIG